MSRIDRFYLGQGLISKGGPIGIMACTSFSDHAPLIMSTQFFKTGCKRAKRAGIPEDVFGNRKWKDEISEIWRAHNSDGRSKAENVANGQKLVTFSC